MKSEFEEKSNLQLPFRNTLSAGIAFPPACCRQGGQTGSSNREAIPVGKVTKKRYYFIEDRNDHFQFGNKIILSQLNL
jgi:hypothetical protein